MLCACRQQPEEEGVRAHTSTQKIILVGRIKKLPSIKLRLSEFLPLLNDLGTLFTLMYYELSFPSLYKDTEFLKSSLKKVFNIFCTFTYFFNVYFFFSSIKTILLQVSRNNADLSSPCSFLFVYIIYRESLLQPLHLDYLTLAIIKYYCDLFLSS